MRIPGKKRRAIGWALIVGGICVVFAIGVVWTVLYYGGILPTITSLSGTYYFDPTTLTFVETIAAFWMFILTIAMVYWWWQQSVQRDPYAS